MPLPSINPGERALLAGSTGSGKSTLGRWLMLRSPGRWVILNPKHSDAFKGLDDSIVVSGLKMALVEKSMQRHRFTIVNPDSKESDADSLDDFIMDLHQGWKNIGLCCDELYPLHKNAVAGKGLMGWLTRGRELKQSFLGMTQRPKWISQFLFSETEYMGEMYLKISDDRKRFYDLTNEPRMLEKIPKRNWLWYDSNTEELTYYGPVSLDNL